MKISSWNVNSVRARIKNITTYLKYSAPDILMMQEIKTEEKNFPFSDFKNLGYDSHIFGQKSYNGVAFLTKIKINKTSKDFTNYKSQTNIKLRDNLYSSYDNFLSNKYEIVINQKTLDRVKNYFE